MTTSSGLSPSQCPRCPCGSSHRVLVPWPGPFLLPGKPPKELLSWVSSLRYLLMDLSRLLMWLALTSENSPAPPVYSQTTPLGPATRSHLLDLSHLPSPTLTTPFCPQAPDLWIYFYFLDSKCISLSLFSSSKPLQLLFPVPETHSPPPAPTPPALLSGSLLLLGSDSLVLASASRITEANILSHHLLTLSVSQSQALRKLREACHMSILSLAPNKECIFGKRMSRHKNK